MKNCLTPKNEKMCDPISSNSTENATPSSGTSPLASYKEVPLPRAEIDNRGKSGFKYYKTYWTFLCFTSSRFIYMRILWLEINANSSIILYYVIWWLQRQETTESLRNFNVKILVKWKSTRRSISCSKTAQFTPILDLPNCKNINWPLKKIPL